MDKQAQKRRHASVVRTLIHFGKMRIKKKPRHEKHKSPRPGPLIRRILLNSAQVVATPSIMSLQRLNATNINRIVVNVGGTKYEIAKKNLEKFPDTLLGSDRKNYFYDKERMEYFFDRDPVIFKSIAEFYRVGSFHVSSPTAICMEAILDELAFFGIPQHHVFDCCCEHIILGDEEQEKLKKQEEAVKRSKHAKKQGLWTARERLWEFLTNTKSSKASAIFGYLFGAVVALNISTIVAETVPTKSDKKQGDVHPTIFFGIDSFCVAIFTVEYIARLYSAPNRFEFVRDISNTFDLLGIIPYYIGLVEHGVQSHNPVLGFFVTVFRTFRVFRVTKLARHSERFQNLLLSVKGAATELGGILFSFLALMVTFSSMMYYFERREQDTKFISIPAAFWYTLVTMTTLGYGDIVPKTLSGQLLGAACALMGVVLLSLPVPIIERQLNEFARNPKPKTDDTTARLAASLPLLTHDSCPKHNRYRKKTRLVRAPDSQTTSMLVEVDNSFDSTTDSSGTSFKSSFGSLHDIRNKVSKPLIEEQDFPDVNGNQNMSSRDAQRRNKSWHGNGDVLTGVGDGIFTDSRDSSRYFPVCRLLTNSSSDDAVEEEKTPSESFGEDDEEKEMIPMKKLRRHRSFDPSKFLQIVAPRNCHSVGDLA